MIFRKIYKSSLSLNNLRNFCDSNRKVMNQETGTKYEPMMKQYAVSGIGKGCGTALTTDDGHQLYTDTPLNHGGNGQYAQPI